MSSSNHFYLFVTITYENNRREDGRFYSSLFSEICAQGYCAIVMSHRNAEHFGCVCVCCSKLLASFVSKLGDNGDRSKI